MVTNYFHPAFAVPASTYPSATYPGEKSYATRFNSAAAVRLAISKYDIIMTTSFVDLGISSEIIKGLESLGFTSPTPVQAQVIPLLLNKRIDIIGLAQTGTGKTAAFGIPLVQLSDSRRNQPQALVLCPTRELCVQVARDLSAFSRYVPALKVAAVYGGAGIEGQLRALRQGCQIIVATPGRLNDLLRRQAVDISGIRILVLDEADEMLQMGFQEELTAILAQTPADKSTLLFSATMPKAVATIAGTYMRKPLEITVGQRNAGAENVRHVYYMVQAKDRYQALRRIVDLNPGLYAIVFCRTRLEVREVTDRLMEDGYDADSLHGELSQSQRDQVMHKFRTRNLQLLVATDVAARGLDVNDLTHVINYNLPDDVAGYTHRSGRTGRAGKTGTSIAIIHLREKHKIKEIETLLKKKFEKGLVPSGQEICREQLLHWVDKVRAAEIDHQRLTPLLSITFDKLASLDREELIKRILSFELNRFLEHYHDVPDLNIRERDFEESRGKADGRQRKPAKGLPFTSISINLGKKQGMHASRLIGQINEAVGPTVRIGKIEVREHATIFEVESRSIRQVQHALGRLKLNGRDVVLEIGTAAKNTAADQEGTQASRSFRPSRNPGRKGRRERI
jgi:ATP-dependent RNA helicase DeaD